MKSRRRERSGARWKAPRSAARCCRLRRHPSSVARPIRRLLRHHRPSCRRSRGDRLRLRHLRRDAGREPAGRRGRGSPRRRIGAFGSSWRRKSKRARTGTRPLYRKSDAVAGPATGERVPSLERSRVRPTSATGDSPQGVRTRAQGAEYGRTSSAARPSGPASRRTYAASDLARSGAELASSAS